jgi:predicted RNA-binding Zn ribbon-like protein
MDLALNSVDDEELLLDLLNTTPVIDGSPTDTLADHRGAVPWLTAHGLSTSRGEWQALRRARAILQAIVRGEETPAALQPILAEAVVIPTATDAGVQWQVTGAGGAVRAALAWDGLRITSPGRLRPCANTECHLFLIDRSKPNTARWCSMAVCGNRMKARRHHSRYRAD